ncbi:hypothetical protein D9C73_019259 [Collichthys lucidus]|uniref:Uncharacterized protein n=1 Tax=Collichthys lucidus TaxID=240159 RepID=A0A4U5VD62_COLLU|nr:hypothetical protein D9C73_019259 [Collichthys lucidus]
MKASPRCVCPKKTQHVCVCCMFLVCVRVCSRPSVCVITLIALLTAAVIPAGFFFFCQVDIQALAINKSSLSDLCLFGSACFQGGHGEKKKETRTGTWEMVLESGLVSTVWQGVRRGCIIRERRSPQKHQNSLTLMHRGRMTRCPVVTLKIKSFTCSAPGSFQLKL